jgi:hypothetical protein
MQNIVDWDCSGQESLHACVCLIYYTTKLFHYKHGYNILRLTSKCSTLCYYHNILALFSCRNTTIVRFTRWRHCRITTIMASRFVFRRLVCPTPTERVLFKHKIEVQNQHSCSGWNIRVFQVILNTRTYTGVWKGMYIYIYIISDMG